MHWGVVQGARLCLMHQYNAWFLQSQERFFKPAFFPQSDYPLTSAKKMVIFIQ
jgi:hypothetical protein